MDCVGTGTAANPDVGLTDVNVMHRLRNEAGVFLWLGYTGAAAL